MKDAGQANGPAGAGAETGAECAAT